MGAQYTIGDVCKKLESYGFVLLDNEYRGLKCKHTIIDDMGYLYYTELGNLLNTGRMPERFRYTNDYTIYNINRYLYLIGSKTRTISYKYINSHSKLEFVCGECGSVYSASTNHVISRNQHICQKCSLIKKGLRHRVHTDKVVAEFEKSGLVPLFDTYSGCDEKLKCIDNKGNHLFITYRSLAQRNKIGLHEYSISMSRYESIVDRCLCDYGIHHSTQFVFDECRDKKVLRFDFAVYANDKDNAPCVLIEVDGQQHYSPIAFGGGDAVDVFTGVVRRDSIKDKYCTDNGIKLIRIPFFDIENGKYIEVINDLYMFLQNIVA